MMTKDEEQLIYSILNCWTDEQAARALEWVENDMPILLGSVAKNYWVKDGAL